ncbi:hypothetical protein [Marininema halotolerans]|uniref:Uncharacterized protein n=1 Tax=Marininema halotolerans TaxID=1155944 RepID=A0A1I6TS53_9BACL|nr:hypothetical protein [Marininema halotolerans]SFS92083.1 hypothetical protein SAMN05444972_11130 [Marininema halotolerans]
MNIREIQKILRMDRSERKKYGVSVETKRLDRTPDVKASQRMRCCETSEIDQGCTCTGTNRVTCFCTCDFDSPQVGCSCAQLCGVNPRSMIIVNADVSTISFTRRQSRYFLFPASLTQFTVVRKSMGVTPRISLSTFVTRRTNPNQQQAFLFTPRLARRILFPTPTSGLRLVPFTPIRG